ncbi:MAG: hypothetical protein ACI9MC_000405 [Kiritimatiellia bacterium]|jgi:hypothetical protein
MTHGLCGTTHPVHARRGVLEVRVGSMIGAFGRDGCSGRLEDDTDGGLYLQFVACVLDSDAREVVEPRRYWQAVDRGRRSSPMVAV